MAFQPWIHEINRSPIIVVAVCGFNGAMAFQPWIQRRHVAGRRGTCASFNGAMAFQPWIPGQSRTRTIHFSRFQWGHGFSAMDTTGAVRHCPRCPAGFQWGHGFSAMDTSRWKMRRSGHPCVSMGPWLFSHGYVEGTELGCREEFVSMGPWLFSHGYGYFLNGFASD